MLDITAPNSLIAAIPFVLGFRPENSMLVVTVADKVLGAVMRVDLDGDTAEYTGRLAIAAASQGADEAVVVVVDAHGEDRSHTELIDTFTDALTIRGVRLLGAFVVDEITAGGRWHCPDGCGAGGALDDPATSVLAAAAVLDGRRVYANRREMQSLVTRDSRRSEAVRAASSPASAPGDPRAAVDYVMDAARCLAEGQAPGDDRLACVAGALLDKEVRDMLLAFALTSDSGAAETFWAMLARSLPAPSRVEALTLLAAYTYIRGDGVMAGIALTAALEEDAAHVLASMLDTALESGMQPDKIKALAELGYRLAREAGIELPAQLENTV
ncbi:DUF4192 domain-containing protein [Mycolicibacterium frederiksbergense]|uniref:DUF4192 domain-containing protein n=1 Tax=Mycolicibacterium frederiksbergense TaxID=117567 RepID=A0A6H0S0D5_9MYCO|nr:DUF4192 domain-containing protein [Mycolicibacterium frederiksbergense]QIV79507.1 DUF4192 domain-containing protein [Mycolicibacterium frederiksbergense]